MAHKTLIGGTAYSVSGGKTKIGGTTYKVDGGKTKIGGTAKTISFALKDLTNTYWKLNEADRGYESGYSNLNITPRGMLAAGGTKYFPMRNDGYGRYYYNSQYPRYMYVRDSATWGYIRTSGADFYADDNVKYIKITGGSDATNATLISHFLSTHTRCDSSWNPL